MSSPPVAHHRFKLQLRERLAQGLPGLSAQQRMVPAGRPMTGLPVERYNRAAVLIALFPEADDWYLPLILRAEGGRFHGGQVALPGGRLEPGETDEAAALREAQEEIGLDPSRVELSGRLSPVPIPVSHHLVTPVLGVLEEAPRWRPQATEVQELFTAGLTQLWEPARRRVRLMETVAGPLRVPYFKLESHEVWGATAIILAELAALLEGLLRPSGDR